MTKRESKAIETRNKIIDSSARLIREKGIDGVSVDEIVKDAGVCKGSFYVYFKKKEDILSVIGYEEFLGLVSEAMKAKGGLSEKIGHYMNSFMDKIVVKGVELCQSWVKTVIVPGTLEWSKFDFDLDSALNLFKELVKEGYLTDSCPLIEFACTMNTHLYGMMICWAMNNGKYDCSIAISFFLEMFIKSLNLYRGGKS